VDTVPIHCCDGRAAAFPCLLAELIGGASLHMKRSPFEVLSTLQRLSSVSSMSNAWSVKMHRLEMPSWSSLWSFSTLTPVSLVEEDVLVVVGSRGTLDVEFAAGFSGRERALRLSL